MSFEMIKRGPDGIDGVIYLYEIPDEWAKDDELFNAWWTPKTEIGCDGLYHIVEEARISDEAKAQRLVREPVHNLITNSGISRILTNQSVLVQASQQPFAQILAAGNGAITGVLRTDTTVPGDLWVASARKAPASYTINGFLSTIVTNYGATDAVGTWTSVGLFGGGSATTGGVNGVLYTHALFPLVKNNSTAYSISYCLLMSN